MHSGQSVAHLGVLDAGIELVFNLVESTLPKQIHKVLGKRLILSRCGSIQEVVAGIAVQFQVAPSVAAHKRQEQKEKLRLPAGLWKSFSRQQDLTPNPAGIPWKLLLSGLTSQAPVARKMIVIKMPHQRFRMSSKSFLLIELHRHPARDTTHSAYFCLHSASNRKKFQVN